MATAPAAYSPAGVPSIRPLGTILIAPGGDGDVQRVADVINHWRVSPWCPAVLLVSRPIPRPTLESIRPAGMSIAAFDGALPPVAVRTAIRQRRIPDTADLASRLEFRCSARVATLFLSVISGKSQPASMRRPLRRLGDWLPHDWVRIDRCMKLIARASAQGWTESAAAEVAVIDVKTLSSWCRRYLHQDWRSLVGLGVWEAVLELALRAGGYVAVR